MVKQTQLALTDAAEWLGDWHPLAEQLGSTEGLRTLCSVSSLLSLKPVRDLCSLRRFLESYQAEILVPFELPSIQTAFSHVSRHEVRELVAFDQQLSGQPLLKDFASASRRVGQAQIRKLRPLRDDRVVQRYLMAVEAGEANGWHTLVYGLTLAIYSLPLRQGLLGYAQQTTRGFIYAAARPLELSERECRGVFDQMCEGLPEAVEQLIVEKSVLA